VRNGGAVHDIEAGVDLEELLADDIEVVLIDRTARIGYKEDALFVPLPRRLPNEKIHPHDQCVDD
jgi:hypothetical protein